METFLGMQVKQSAGKISLLLDKCIQDIVTEYSEFTPKTVCHRKTQSQPGLVLTKDDCPTAPDQVKQKFYRLIFAKLQFAAAWIQFDISYQVAQLA